MTDDATQDLSHIAEGLRPLAADIDEVVLPLLHGAAGVLRVE